MDIPLSLRNPFLVRITTALTTSDFLTEKFATAVKKLNSHLF